MTDEDPDTTPSLASITRAIQFAFASGMFTGKPTRITPTDVRGLSFEWDTPTGLVRTEFFEDGSMEHAAFCGDTLVSHELFPLCGPKVVTNPSTAIPLDPPRSEGAQ